MFKTANHRIIATTKRIETQDLWKQACRNADVFVADGTCIPAKIIARLGPGTLMAELIGLGTANIGKRKPQQTIDRKCASVNYTESASAEAQFHSSLVCSKLNGDINE